MNTSLNYDRYASKLKAQGLDDEDVLDAMEGALNALTTLIGERFDTAMVVRDMLHDLEADFMDAMLAEDIHPDELHESP